MYESIKKSVCLCVGNDETDIDVPVVPQIMNTVKVMIVNNNK